MGPGQAQIRLSSGSAQAEQPRQCQGLGAAQSPQWDSPTSVGTALPRTPGHSPAPATAPARPLPAPERHNSAPGHLSDCMERQFSLSSSPSSPGSCSRNTETSTPSPPLTAFPSALTRTAELVAPTGLPILLVSSLCTFSYLFFFQMFLSQGRVSLGERCWRSPERGLDTLSSLGTKGHRGHSPASCPCSAPRLGHLSTPCCWQAGDGEERAGISTHKWSSIKPSKAAEDSTMTQSAASPDLPFRKRSHCSDLTASNSLFCHLPLAQLHSWSCCFSPQVRKALSFGSKLLPNKFSSCTMPSLSLYCPSPLCLSHTRGTPPSSHQLLFG